MRAPRASWRCVAASSSEPNCANASHLAVLGEVELEAAGDLLHRLDLRVRPDARDRDADVDGRPHAREEEARLEEDLAVGDRDDVRRDVGRHVAGLRLDDRQRRERPAAELVGELDRALEQPGVQVEDVAREGLAARRAADQQRHLPVGVGLLGEVVVDAQRGRPRVAEVLAHGARGVGRDVLDRRGLGGRARRRRSCAPGRHSRAASRRPARRSRPSARSRSRCR